MKLKKRFFYILLGVWAMGSLASCADDESFSASPSHVLSFSVDTLKLDTVFSNVSTPTHSFWVYNRSGKSLRCPVVRLQQGNQTGYRVNVDGSPLSAADGYRVQDVEIRKGDSIRVFVELTSPQQHADEPQLVSDNLVFSLESGVEQKVPFKAYAWDALLLNGLTVDESQVLQENKPVVMRGDIVVAEQATLTIAAGTQLFFHENAGILVKGSLRVEGEAGKEVVMRGDRLDHMFSYLPYDRTPGQWQGIQLMPSSHDNIIRYADIHSTYDGVVAEGEEHDERSKLSMQNATVHNCQGFGVKIGQARVQLENCQLSNALENCLYVKGGEVLLNGCTIAQFYPFDGLRGVAFCVEDLIGRLDVKNSLITGYRDKEVEIADGIAVDFSHCVVRKGDADDMGEKHFRLIDTENLKYDFHLSEESTAIGAADAESSLPVDRDGTRRRETPAAGCYEY